jgi:hypothetical protein
MNLSTELPITGVTGVTQVRGHSHADIDAVFGRMVTLQTEPQQTMHSEIEHVVSRVVPAGNQRSGGGATRRRSSNGEE